jgi:hypothetical protein
MDEQAYWAETRHHQVNMTAATNLTILSKPFRPNGATTFSQMTLKIMEYHDVYSFTVVH